MRLAVPLVVLALLIACTNNDAGKQPPAAAAGATAPASTPPAGQPAASTAVGPAAATAPPTQAVSTPPPPSEPAAAKPLATSQGSLDRVRIEVTELRQSASGTVSLRFTIVNESARPLRGSDVGFGPDTLVPADATGSGPIRGVYLVDLAGKKKYFVARDSGGGCLCSTFQDVQPGARGNHWARFAAPADNVDRLTVVIPGFEPMDDVPLSR